MNARHAEPQPLGPLIAYLQTLLFNSRQWFSWGLMYLEGYLKGYLGKPCGSHIAFLVLETTHTGADRV